MRTQRFESTTFCVQELTAGIWLRHPIFVMVMLAAFRESEIGRRF
jgi:hypothetical protein